MCVHSTNTCCCGFFDVFIPFFSLRSSTVRRSTIQFMQFIKPRGSKKSLVVQCLTMFLKCWKNQKTVRCVVRETGVMSLTLTRSDIRISESCIYSVVNKMICMCTVSLKTVESQSGQCRKHTHNNVPWISFFLMKTWHATEYAYHI